MDKFQEILQNNKALLISLALVFVYFGILFGFTGLLFFIGLLVLIVPVYLIIDLMKLEKAEKLILSFPLSIGIYSSFVYYLAFLFSSIRISIVATFFVLILFYIAAVKLKSKNLIRNDAFILIGLMALILIFWLIAKFTVINYISQPEYAARFVECLQSNTLEFCKALY